jgi:hypothetical protein
VAALPALYFQDFSDVFAQPQKEGMPHLPFGGLGAVLDLGEKLRLKEMTVFADQYDFAVALSSTSRLN